MCSPTSAKTCMTYRLLDGKNWTLAWGERKYPRPTGMIWKGGVLGYKYPPGPISQFWHTLHTILLKGTRGRMSMFDTKSMPAASGNQIRFFTYAL